MLKEESPLEYVTVPRGVAQSIDTLVKLSNLTSPEGFVETQKDWEVFKHLFSFWKYYYPDQYKDFRRSCDIYRSEYLSNKGMHKEGEAFVQHRLEMPESLHKIILVIFPKVKYDRKFIDRLIKEIPEFKISS